MQYIICHKVLHFNMLLIHVEGDKKYKADVQKLIMDITL